MESAHVHAAFPAGALAIPFTAVRTWLFVFSHASFAAFSRCAFFWVEWISGELICCSSQDGLMET